MAACQPPNQPPRRTWRCRAHTLRISQSPIAEFAAFSAPHPPRVLSLAAFGRRLLVYVVPISLAGIRNPKQQATFKRDGNPRLASTLAAALVNGQRADKLQFRLILKSTSKKSRAIASK